jgi:hypothetical protein
MQMPDYWLRGWTTGTCRCEGALGCACWNRATPCSQFVAYCLEAGVINGIDVGGTTVIRLIASSGTASILYLDARSSFAQQQALVSAFTGRFGGKLAALARLAPIELPPKLAVIQTSQQQQQAQIAVGQLFMRTHLPTVSFECEQSICSNSFRVDSPGGS